MTGKQVSFFFFFCASLSLSLSPFSSISLCRRRRMSTIHDYSVDVQKPIHVSKHAVDGMALVTFAVTAGASSSTAACAPTLLGSHMNVCSTAPCIIYISPGMKVDLDACCQTHLAAFSPGCLVIDDSKILISKEANKSAIVVNRVCRPSSAQGATPNILQAAAACLSRREDAAVCGSYGHQGGVGNKAFYILWDNTNLCKVRDHRSHRELFQQQIRTIETFMEPHRSEWRVHLCAIGVDELVEGGTCTIGMNVHSVVPSVFNTFMHFGDAVIGARMDGRQTRRQLELRMTLGKDQGEGGTMVAFSHHGDGEVVKCSSLPGINQDITLRWICHPTDKSTINVQILLQFADVMLLNCLSVKVVERPRTILNEVQIGTRLCSMSAEDGGCLNIASTAEVMMRQMERWAAAAAREGRKPTNVVAQLLKERLHCLKRKMTELYFLEAACPEANTETFRACPLQRASTCWGC